MFKRLSLATGILSLAAAPAFAHLDPLEHGSFAAGLSHPMFGIDHLLAMVAVGLWAAQIANRASSRAALWAVPLAFIVTMTFGFGLAQYGVGLPFVEPAILASVVGLGLLVAAAVRLPLSACAAVVAMFALFHGYAHGSELGTAGALQNGAGFVVSTAMLHATGLGLGMIASRFAPSTTRIAGLVTAVAGASLILGG